MATFKIFVGNINKITTNDRLKAAFAKFGEVLDVAIAMDKATGKSRGFAFVFMADDEGGRMAIERLNNERLDGRRLVVAPGDKKSMKEARAQQAATQATAGPPRQRKWRGRHGRGASKANAGNIRVYRRSDEQRPTL